MKRIISCIIITLMLVSSTLIYADDRSENKKNNSSANIQNQIREAEKQFKDNHWKENEGNKFLSQLTDLRKKLLEKNKNFKWKALTIYINGTEFKSDGSSIIAFKNVNIPADLISKGFGANLEYTRNTRTMNITKGSVNLVIDLSNKKITLNGNEITPNILSTAKNNASIQLIRFIAIKLGFIVNINEKYRILVVEAIVDKTAPSVPASLSVSPQSTTELHLKWAASSDNLGVLGYKVFRNSIQIATVVNGTFYSDKGLTLGTQYVYTVSAYDVAGNNSAQSAAVVGLTFSAISNGNGLRGDYFDNMDFTDQKLTRIDPRIAFNWGTRALNPLSGRDTFSVRWTGQVLPLYSEEYTFITLSDDGVRLWVNGIQLIDNWTNHSEVTNQGKIKLNAGQKYDIRLEFFNNTGDATIHLSWSSPSQSKQVIPQGQLFGVTTDSGLPTVPTLLSALAVSPNQVNLSWTKSTDYFAVKGYKIFRGGVQIGTVGNVNIFTDTGLTASTTYLYTVSAFDAAGNNSAQSLAVTVTTKVPPITVVNDNVLGTGDNQFNYSANWNYGSEAGAYMKDNHWSSITDAFYQVQFTGTQIKIYGAMDVSHGIAKIFIDGILVTTVDFYATARSDNVLVYTSQLLQQGPHKLKVVVSGAKNNSATNYNITIDRIEIIS